MTPYRNFYFEHDAPRGRAAGQDVHQMLDVKAKFPKGARKPLPDATVFEIPEVMYILRIGRTRAYTICEEKALGHYREGSSIRVPIEAIVEYQGTKMVHPKAKES